MLLMHHRYVELYPLTVWLADDVSAALAVWQGYLISARVNACNYSPKTPPFFFKIRKTVYC